MNSVVIVAGGQGTRMGTETPKQFLLLNGKPIFIHTINAFLDAFESIELILVFPEEHLSKGEALLREYLPDINCCFAKGGETRFHSVKNGLEKASGKIVGVHDAVRPLVRPEDIKKCYKKAEELGSGVLCTPSKDSLRKIEEGGSRSVPRDEYLIVQTPQVFQKEILERAYAVDFISTFTDDASVVEADGFFIHLVEGADSNLKITTPSDLIVAEALLTKRNREGGV